MPLMVDKNVACGGSLPLGERQDSDAGGQPPAPAYPPGLRKALYLLSMNEHKRGVKPETVERLKRQLRDACLAHLKMDEVAIRSLAVEIGDWVDTPDFQLDPNANADTINAIEDIITRWVGGTCRT